MAANNQTDTQPVNRQHLLLALGQSRQVASVDLTPPECEYDTIAGAWISSNGRPFVETPGHIAQATKKADIETGEDAKGA